MKRVLILTIECDPYWEHSVVERLRDECRNWAPDFGRLESIQALTIITEQQDAHVRSWRQYILDETEQRT